MGDMLFIFVKSEFLFSSVILNVFEKVYKIFLDGLMKIFGFIYIMDKCVEGCFCFIRKYSN